MNKYRKCHSAVEDRSPYMKTRGIRKVLMVCMGNICRSPIAEAVFNHLVAQRGLQDLWFADSAGISGYHTGKLPDLRSQRVLKENHIPYYHTARQISTDDFYECDYIFGMDLDNIGALHQAAPRGSRAHIYLLGVFDPEGDKIIKDPYYGAFSGFVKVFEQCVRSCSSFLNRLEEIAAKR